MDISREEKLKNARLQRSQEIASEVKNGSYQQPAFSKEESWFPQRKVIKRDKNLLELINTGDQDD